HANRKSLLHLEGLWIKRHDLRRIFEVDVDQAVRANHSLFAVSLGLHRADHLAGVRIERAYVVSPMIVCEHSLGGRIVVNSVGSSANVNLLDEMKRRDVKHRDFVFPAVACEAVFELGCERYPVNTGSIGDCSNELSVVGVHYIDLRSMRKVDATRLRV